MMVLSVAPGFIVAGTHSGVGKTTASFILMAALTDSGFSVQPFKIGPDFIDPGYHRLATGRPSINLDLWMMGIKGVRRAYAEHAHGADAVVVEGMGALFDGENGVKARGSAAYFARHLGIPIVLVVDIWGMTRSATAVVKGFLTFDPSIRIVGIIFNRAGSRKHFEMVLASMPSALRRSVLGYIIADEQLRMPERHLGLLTVEENSRACTLRGELLAKARDTLDVDRLMRILGLRTQSKTVEQTPPTRRLVRLGLAQDKAFCFYYEDNLRMLQGAGAELVPFSPMEDLSLPADLDGIYIGGGYPELFARVLSNNTQMIKAIYEHGQSGMPMYAECGGLMYLSNTLTDFDGQRLRMVALLPLDVAMDRTYLAIRYVSVRLMCASVLGPKGTRARGHEFHQSRITKSSMVSACYTGLDSYGTSFREGHMYKNVFGSYIHIHFASNRSIPRNMVNECLRYRARRSRTAL